MSLETGLLGAAGVATSAMGISSDEDARAASQQGYNDQVAALNLQGQEESLIYKQKQLDNYDQLNNILDSQEAVAVAHGVDLSSPSLNAIQRSTINTGAKKFQTLYTENEINQTNIDIEKAKAKSQEEAQEANINSKETSEAGGLFKDLMNVFDSF